jgi:hypothetical protein
MKSLIKIAAKAALIGVLVSISTFAAQRRVALPHPVLFMYGYLEALPATGELYTPQQYNKVWYDTIQVLNVIDGITQNADFVNRLRAQGKIFTYHVLNHVDATHKTVDDFVNAWSQPFENTLGGKLPGGFDAICIDEFNTYRDGTPESRLQNEALKKTREKYPDRLIFVSGVGRLGDGGIGSLSGDKSTTYNDTLNAIQKYADVFLLEHYLRSGNPQFEYFASKAKNIHDNCPGLMEKTIYILQIAQTPPETGDDNPKVNFFSFLESQFKAIKTGPLTQRMPGIGFWVFYRSKPETVEEVLHLVQQYYK